MKKTRYTFGYLFVRFSKLLAILTALATSIHVIYLWIDYGLKADNIAYRKTSTLSLQCRQLEDELEFTKREVSRIGSVGDLSSVKFPSDSSNSREIDALLDILQISGRRQSVLKERLTDGFASRTELLRNKIKTVIDSIEAARAAARPDPQAQISPNPTQIARTTPSQQAVGRQRTVFDSIDSESLDNMYESMRKAGLFLDQLASKAEKEESKKLIQDSKAALNDLTSWLPSKKVDTNMEPSIGRIPLGISAGELEEEDEGPPPDPLTTARNNYENLGNTIEMVKTEICRGWHSDRLLLETTKMAENEAQKCRSAESSLKILRLSSAGKVATYLLIGLVVAFLILVFADFLQSFFDTASSSASIFEVLDRTP